MADHNTQADEAQAHPPDTLQAGTYEIIRNRLLTQSKDLRERLEKLNTARREAFGTVAHELLASERVSTDNNCVPRDIVAIGGHCLFGYNVYVGLRTETTLADVFALYRCRNGAFGRQPLDLIQDARFITDFKNLYKYYRRTVFAKFRVMGQHLFMVFRVGRDVTDIKTFKWLIQGDTLQYLDNRSDHECVFPPQHEFEWTRTTQDMFHEGKHPHISIQDRVFVETVGGDLTVKIEDNTETGEGIYAEPVENQDQTLSDAEVYFASIGSVVLIKIRPYEEKDFRYLLYNEKLKTAQRLDALHEACVLLPEDHGLIFPKGYYLHTGVLKRFDIAMEAMLFEKRLASPNGEDFLFVFYNRDSGVYVLLSYNIIEQKVGTPVICNGYSLLENGRLQYFRADDEPKKHHVIQIWQTPYYGPNFSVPVKQDSGLYKIGNRDIVRCMAECHEVLTLIAQEESYANLYLDIARRAEDICDTYFWIDNDNTFHLRSPLSQIRQAADAAIEEYEKVVRTRENTRRAIQQAETDVHEAIATIRSTSFDTIEPFVEHLSHLRAMRGRVVSLRDLRYAEESLINALEAEISQHTDTLSRDCVTFLLDPAALTPYRQTIARQEEHIAATAKVTEVKALQEQVTQTGTELEMLTDIVSNLKIEDATQTVAIIDAIATVYGQVNRAKAALKNRLNDLGRREGQAEFSAQIKLIEQMLINTLDICDTAPKCDEYLSKAMIQVETLESRFADFEDFILELTDKREEIYSAFESRKGQLIAANNQRAATLLASAERLLKGIENRAHNLASVEAINGYFAADLMIERVHDTVTQLTDLGDTVKAEDIQSRLKTIHQDAVRQRKDKLALYEDGESIIRLGEHRFAVNHQTLTGTLVRQETGFFFHLTGTGFFAPVTEEALAATQAVWDLEVPSESPTLYRAAYLAYQFLHAGAEDPAEDLETLTQQIQTFMGTRYDEGYLKGVHDRDAACYVQLLVGLSQALGLLRYTAPARALATVYWHLADRGPLLGARLQGLGQVQERFGPQDSRAAYVADIRERLGVFVTKTALFDPTLVDEAADYLFDQVCTNSGFVVSRTAQARSEAFQEYLRQSGSTAVFETSLADLAADPVQAYRLLTEWLRAYEDDSHVEEAATLLMPACQENRILIDVAVEQELTGLSGSHPTIEEGTTGVNYGLLMAALRQHDRTVAPRFREFVKLKSTLTQGYTEKLHLDNFKPRVLSTFVRNQLLDRHYLPLIGDNLAKQIGTEGKQKRTDRQGLLMLISPPGYGKTTLMEYVANRLGLTFVKINGPALGHRVFSLDPAEAPNAAARSELEKLNLALEMGDNVMIYVDDIQHTHAEFLQKFISLCDAQRRIEGVYQGEPKTYDLRGKRVCVIMAGNPYTESGERFRIPDMLANRADTYNIGDIVGNNADAFALSYIENSLTSNPVLEGLARRSQQDTTTLITMAATGQQEGMDLEGHYTAEEINEYLTTLKKLFTVREVVLRVNQEYIRSAGQAAAYRTEPPFLLQGSYRNMNRIAARVMPLMNEEELWTLILSSYEQDAQTLTSGAEANLLKFRDLIGRLDDTQRERWQEIKKTFQRNLLLGGNADDTTGRLLGQLNAMSTGLEGIKEVMTQGLGDMHTTRSPQEDPLQQASQEILNKMGELVSTIQQQRQDDAVKAHAEQSRKSKQDTQTLVAVLEEQFHAMQTWLMPMTHGHKKDKDRVIAELTQRFETMIQGYTKLIDVLHTKRQHTPQGDTPLRSRKKKTNRPKKKEPNEPVD